LSQYFYDSQIKRFLIQFAKLFSMLEVEYGKDPNGNPIYHRVPVQYGDSSRQAATIIANNSASNLPSTPLITYYITGLEYDQKRTQEPYFVDKLNVRQRALNPETGEYETTQGNAFTIERLMPVPYTLRLTVDFWTSNVQQKLQIFEQLGVLFNPSMEIQSTDNFVDWTSLSTVYQERLNWSSRSIPVGTGNPIDVMSWSFYLPIWISSPTKVRKLGVIQKIIASIYTGAALDDIQNEDLLLGTRQKITPYGYQLLLIGNSLQILPASQPEYLPNTDVDMPTPPNTAVYWHSVLNVYGVVREGVSMIALDNPHSATEIMGTIAYNPTDDRLLVYNIDPDTLPQNTLDPVNSIINPVQKFPSTIGIDNGLPIAAIGQRYLILENIPQQIPYSPTPAPENGWPGLTSGANANDIIEYDGTNWFIAFNSVVVPVDTVEFITNLTTQIQYRYVEGGWMKSFEGYYNQGDWRIVI
jgi:hypothetical protein